MKRLTLLIVLPAVVWGCDREPLPTAVPAEIGVVAATVGAERGAYVVVFAKEEIPADFGERVERLGGRVSRSMPAIGVAAVTELTGEAAAQLLRSSEIVAVERDLPVPLTEAAPRTTEDEILATDLLREHDSSRQSDDLSSSSSQPLSGSPTDALLYARQWHLRAIRADAAWAAGRRGSRTVTVAILDTGIDYLHPDLAGLVDLDRSRSFVPEDDALLAQAYPGRHPVTDLFFHGTAVASIVASNARVLAGVNQQVTLIGVKVAGRNGEFTPSAAIAGLTYAADLGVDVVNASGGAYFDLSENPGLATSYRRALNYAARKGVLFVGAVGNNGADHDHDGDMVRTCALSHGMCVSATGPTAAAGINGPWTEVDAFASYSGFGRSVVDVAAPGGQRFAFTRVWVSCTTAPAEFTPPPCRNAGAPIEQRVVQAVGVSWAVAHVSGLAALLMAEDGQPSPDRVKSIILRSTDDLGEPGVDPYYGHGRVNVEHALRLLKEEL